jgi:type I restriction enzyme S subunit
MNEMNTTVGAVIRFIRNGTTDPQADVETDYPVSRIETISDGKINFGKVKFLSHPREDFRLQCGDILFSHINSIDHIGKAAYYESDKPLYHGMNLLCIRPDEQRIYPRFLHYVLTSEQARNHARRECKPAVNQASLGQRDVSRFKFFSPRIAQQRRIAEILSTLDETIEQTEALIAKMQQVKAGLMHDLFTRGVTPDGHLRLTREQAPELYKESQLGWIPKEWELRPCSAICEKITVGIVVRPTQYYVPEGIPAFRSANIQEAGIYPADFVFISPQSNALLAKSQVQSGDIISVRTGYPGTSAVVPEEFSGANCIDVLISRPGSLVRSSFLTNWINSSFGKDQVLRKQGGLAQQHFNVGELRDLLVVLPDLSEQDAIVERMVAVSEWITKEQAFAEKLYLQKNGLMHDLLTGCVRVH